jgi:regulatory protein
VKISKIEPQKKNKNRCSIYINGEFKFGLTKDLVLKYDLGEGDEITDDEIKNVLLEEEKQKIKQRAFRILHYRDRSAQELKKRLIRIGFDQSLVDQVIEDFVEDKTLDDERFIKAFINDYTKLKPKGNIFIIHELRKRGFSREMVIKMLNNRDEKSIIKSFIQKKLSHLDKNNPKVRQKIIRRLLSRGFTPNIVYDVLAENTWESL